MSALDENPPHARCSVVVEFVRQELRPLVREGEGYAVRAGSGDGRLRVAPPWRARTTLAGVELPDVWRETPGLALADALVLASLRATSAL